MINIAVIGGGIFGCSAALELAKKGYSVTLFEKSNSLLSGASKNNHLRHHYGYHYPRSKETALESINSRNDFEKEYGTCIISGFPAYYAVSKENTKSTPEEFIKFCNDLNLPYEIVETDKRIFDSSKISLCIKTPEPAYDPEVLKSIVEDKLIKNKVKVLLNHEIISGKIIELKKNLTIKTKNSIFNEDFDFIVSAIYSNFNHINQWFGFKNKKFQYDLMELVDVKIPIKERIGAMIVDGDFSTFVPLKEPGVVRLGHSKYVFLKTVVTDNIDTDSLITKNKISNKEKIISESSKYYPIFKKAKYLRSTFIVRIIKADVSNTDERPSEITTHGNGIYSIFGGKVITSVTTAKNITNLISKEVK